MTDKPRNLMIVLRSKLLLGIAGLLILIMACNLPFLIASPTPPTQTEPDPQVVALEQLEADSQTTPELYFENGFPRGVLVSVPVEGANSVKRARNFLNTYQDLYLQSNPDLALEVLRTSGEDDENVVFYQTYKGLPVFAGEIAVRLDGEQVYAAVGGLLNSDVNLDTLPAIAPAEAEALARAALDLPDAPVIGSTTLMIFDQSLFDTMPPDPRLAWKVTFGGGDPWQAFVDAHTGEVLFRYVLSETGGGLSDYDYEEWDAVGTKAADSKCYWGAGPDSIGDEDGLEENYFNDVDAVNVWWYTRWAYLFFHDTFGLHSYDNDDTQIEVGIHANVDNAQWQPGCDIIEFANGWVSYDVTVHELGHGVIQYTSNLIYVNEPGALNESFADVMGALADADDWLMAEDRTSGKGPIRNLSKDKPDKMSDIWPAAIYMDNGGVHTNSLIVSRAAYLIAQGGFHNGWTVNGIGRGKMGVLFYVTMTSQTSGAGFFGAAMSAIGIATNWANSAAYGFTADDACQVRNAFAAVELAAGDFGCDGILDPGDKDTDGDYVLDSKDNCDAVKNPNQKDTDYDGKGDVCDDDDDNDGVKDKSDNCVLAVNPDQKDFDNDGKGDACDDSDKDGVMDDKDNCVTKKNPYQQDLDGDGKGDACDDDDDNDGVKDISDNCQWDTNPDQKDTDNDGEGDACEVDTDADGWSNDNDNCPFTPNADQANADGDGAGDACDPTPTCTDVYAWSMGQTIGEVEIPPKPIADPQACPPRARPDALDIKPDGRPHQIDLPGEPGRHVTLALPACPPDREGWYSQDFRALLTLDGLGMGVRFMIVDGEGSRRARFAATEDQFLMLFKPPAGQMYFLDLLFPDDFPSGELLTFGATLSCGGKDELHSRFPSQPESGLRPPPEPGEPAPVATATPTSTPTYTPTSAQPCTWTAAVNVFARKGPSSTYYDDVWSYTPGESAPVVGQSTDSSWWALDTPGGIGYIPKDPRFGNVTGACEVPRFTPVPTITPTPTATPIPRPQCSDGIDNDGDGRIDLDDAQCRNANDNDEAVP